MSREAGPFNLHSNYLRLRPDASAEVLPVGRTFWQDLAEGSLGNFHNEYLVTSHSFSENWPMWEMHPCGDEMVILLTGSVDLVLEKKTGNKVLPLREVGGWALVPKGMWHTAKVNAPSTLMFITAGEGTQHRQVDF
ncbi:MAG: cupin domain-containing protein [Pseudomonadota bacterium]